MNILADENVDGQIVARLRDEGHQVLYVTEMEPGISDEIVLARANEHQALLMTADKDFGELVFRLGQISTGVILLRLSDISPERKAEIVSIAISSHASFLIHSFTVISPGRVRIRANQ